MRVRKIQPLNKEEKDANKIWDKILNSDKILSDQEAEDMHELVRKLRKEWGYRNISDF